MAVIGMGEEDNEKKYVYYSDYSDYSDMSEKDNYGSNRDDDDASTETDGDVQTHARKRAQKI